MRGRPGWPPRPSHMQQQKNLRSLKIVVLTGASIGVGIAVALSVIAGCVHWLESRPKPWRQDAISAAFSGFLSEREHPKLDAPSASGTARDPVVIEFGELYGGSIRFPARGKLVYPIFVPANQKAEVVVTFEPRNAKGIADILKSEDTTEHIKEFMRREESDLGGFVLFDRAMRYQVTFPKGW